MHHVKRIEVFDVSAVAFALLGAGIEYEIKGVHWFDVRVGDGDENFIVSLIERAIGVANSTPMLEIKHMAGCCGLGYLLQNRDSCPYCGAHKVPKTTGEPPWRCPEGALSKPTLKPMGFLAGEAFSLLDDE